MRRALLVFVRWLGEALVRLYYSSREVEGRERVPPAGAPTVFVLNHPNGLLDPLLLRVAVGRPARFLAKSTLFANPFGRLAMDAFGSIPIDRAREARAEAKAAGERLDTAGRNDESFARCRAELAGGGSLALFPEGVSHSDPQLRPLKTGAARIALSAEAEHDGRLGAVLLPVGLYYERKARFRSSVLLAVGEPIAVGAWLPDYRRDERAAVAALTARIDAGMDEVVLQAESRELLEGIARVARWTATARTDGDGDDLASRHERARRLLDAYGRLRAREPERVETIAGEARAFARALRRLGVRDPWALELAAPSAGALAGALAAMLLAAPLAALGAALGWIPYRLAGELATRLTKDEDILGTVKLIAGAVFLIVGWAAEAVAVGLLAGPAWALPTFAAGVATGYVALRFGELAREAALVWRHLAFRRRHGATAERLIERRRALAETVTRALAASG